MNLSALVLAVSVALNLALLATFAAKPSLAPPAARSFFTGAGAPEPPVPETSTPDREDRALGAGEVALWNALHSTDLPTLVARLRAAGFPPAMVRAVVDAEIERQFSPRIQELLQEARATPFWKPDATFSTAAGARRIEQLNQIYRERSRALRELLGKDAFAWAGIDPSAAQRQRFGNLAPAKIDLVQRISDDYDEMMGQVRAAAQGITLPEDREAIALLERERRADLAAVLTPQELADYEMRTSTTTMRLRTAMSIMDASEAEFRTIYQAHEAFKDTLYPTSTGGIVFITSENSQRRRDATVAIDSQLKAALGEERFADYKRATDREYQQLFRLGQRDNIAPDALRRAYDLRGTVAEESARIVNDAALSPTEKQTALKNLAQNARTRILGTLGPSAGPMYADSARWLSYLEQGRGVTINPDGSILSRSIGSPRLSTPALPIR